MVAGIYGTNFHRRKTRRVSMFVMDRDALTESFSAAQKFVCLQAAAIGREPTTCPKSGWLRTTAARKRKRLSPHLTFDAAVGRRLVQGVRLLMCADSDGGVG